MFLVAVFLVVAVLITLVVPVTLVALITQVGVQLHLLMLLVAELHLLTLLGVQLHLLVRLGVLVAVVFIARLELELSMSMAAEVIQVNKRVLGLFMTDIWLLIIRLIVLGTLIMILIILMRRLFGRITQVLQGLVVLNRKILGLILLHRLNRKIFILLKMVLSRVSRKVSLLLGIRRRNVRLRGFLRRQDRRWKADALGGVVTSLLLEKGILRKLTHG